MKRGNDTQILLSKGFTLIEIIVGIVVAGILGAMLVVLMGSNITQSATPVNMVKDQNRVNQVMENIVAHYKQQIKDGTLNLGTFPASIQAASYWGNDVSMSTSYVNYVDADGDGTYDEVTCTYGPGCKILKITLSKGLQKVITLFTE
ncbi:MAG: type II secretion system GspH family protein [Syntrophales bacterium]|nr:type II secretion system GspH family protein [Syntrophales bacterium]